MTKTAQQIEDDIYDLLCGSALSQAIDGKVYKFGTRPKDSAAEDAIVKFVAGLDGQMQSGNVVVNIYVPDVMVGTNMRNITRCTQIEAFALNWVRSLPVSEYLFALAATIQTFEEPDIKQHFVSVRLNYKRYTI